MQGVPEQFEHPLDVAQFRRPAHRTGVELYRAHIVRHTFEPHTHEAFGLGAIEKGVERFRYRGSDHLAPADSRVMMNPDVLHTGRAETVGGWRYRMAYIDADVVEAVTGRRGLWFRDAVDHDATLARRITTLLDALWQADEPLAFDGLLLALLDGFGDQARSARPAEEHGTPRFSRVVDYLRDNLSQRLTLDGLAAVAELSPFHFLRAFRDQYDVTPQQMLMALRLFEAKRRLADGQGPAQVAAEVGLSDQAHLTRTFARRYGVTPARYQRQLRG